jgi:hypothetical protein
MHVIVRERDTESPAIGTQVEASNAHKVLINTNLRTMEITEQDGGALLVRASDLLGHPVPVRNELQDQPAEFTMRDAKKFLQLGPQDCDGSGTCPAHNHIEGCFSTNPDYNPQTPKEAMLRVGIQGIVSTFFHESAAVSSTQRNVLVDRLFSYVRKGLQDAPPFEITEDLLEHAARSAFNRPGANRGCVWLDPLGLAGTTEKTREEFRLNTFAALNAALQRNRPVRTTK